MGLDQYLYHSKPDIFNPYSHGEEIGYWRKDWDLQHFIGSGNGEFIEVDAALCQQILAEFSHESRTRKPFTQALSILAQGGRITYEADW